MSIVSTPYRWLWRTWWKNITHWGWDIRNGVRNLYVFFDAVWWFRGWDWNGMLDLLRVSANEMRYGMLQGIHVGDERYAKQLLIIKTLCERLMANDYFKKAGYDPDTWSLMPDFRASQIAKHASYMAKQDAEYLGKTMRFIQHWWS